MGNYDFTVRLKRWIKFFFQAVGERVRGLDFSTLYVGDLQRNTEAFHGYSMTDADAMREMLRAVPVEVSAAAFLDVGCGKGMCMKCAKELGYGKVAGIDLDPHLVEIAERNMAKLHMEDVACIYANAAEFDRYADYDVFYFYNPFGRSIFEEVAKRLKESQKERDRDLWVIYYHPVFADVFENAGFKFQKEIPEKTRDTVTRIYLYPKGSET